MGPVIDIGLVPGLALDPLVVVIERVLPDGHGLEPQHEVLPRGEVVVVPDVEHVGLLAVQRHGDHKAHRPRGGRDRGLVLPALLLGAPRDPERPDAVPDDMDDIVQIDGFSGVIPPRPRLPAEPAFIQVLQQLQPQVGRVVALDAELDARQDVVDRAQVDQGVDGRAQPRPVHRAVLEPRAEHAVAVQAQDEGEVPVVDRVGQLHNVNGGDLGLREVHDGHDLLDLVRDVEVRVLAREVAGLAVRVGREVAQQAGAVVDPGVGRVVQRLGQPAGPGQRALVHDHLRELDARAEAAEEVAHSVGSEATHTLYIHGAQAASSFALGR